MAIAQFKIATDANILIVPYKGAAPAITDTIGGQVDGFFGDVSGLVQHIKNGGVVPIGLAAAKRSAALPDVPTMDELGIKNVHAINWYGIFAPRGTPKDKIESLNAAMRTALESEAAQNYVRVSGLDASPTSPEEFGQMIEEDTAKWATLIKAENITVYE